MPASLKKASDSETESLSTAAELSPEGGAGLRGKSLANAESDSLQSAVRLATADEPGGDEPSDAGEGRLLGELAPWGEETSEPNDEPSSWGDASSEPSEDVVPPSEASSEPVDETDSDAAGDLRPAPKAKAPKKAARKKRPSKKRTKSTKRVAQTDPNADVDSSRDQGDDGFPDTQVALKTATPFSEDDSGAESTDGGERDSATPEGDPFRLTDDSSRQDDSLVAVDNSSGAADEDPPARVAWPDELPGEPALTTLGGASMEGWAGEEEGEGGKGVDAHGGPLAAAGEAPISRKSVIAHGVVSAVGACVGALLGMLIWTKGHHPAPAHAESADPAHEAANGDKHGAVSAAPHEPSAEAKDEATTEESVEAEKTAPPAAGAKGTADPGHRPKSPAAVAEVPTTSRNEAHGKPKAKPSGGGHAPTTGH